MEVLESSFTGVPLLLMKGDVDHATAPILEEAVQRLLASERARVRARLLLFDLSDCPYIDSGGLAVLLSAVRTLRPDGWIGILGASPDLLRLFEIVGLTSEAEFRLFGTEAEAAEALSG